MGFFVTSLALALTRFRIRRVGGSIESESLRLSGCLVVFHRCSPVFLLAKATPGDISALLRFPPSPACVFAH